MRVLITGANGGLGGAVVNVFGEAGALVFGVDRAWAPTVRAGLKTIVADVTTFDGCHHAVHVAGPVDVLIHLIGGFAGGTLVEETDEEVWNNMMNVNLRAAFLMFRAVLPGMRAAGRGRILAVGSRIAVEPAANLAAYGASKAALVHLVRTLALEVKDAGITANVLLPGTIDTPANRAAMPQADFSTWVAPDSIAKLMLWLASDEAAPVNGAAIPIFGK